MSAAIHPSSATWLPREPNVVALLDAAYRVDRDEESWSQHLTAAFARSVSGAVFTGGFVFDASTPGKLVARAMSSDNAALEGWRRWADSGEMDAYVERMFPVHARVGAASERLGADFETFAASARGAVPMWVEDSWSVAGANLHRQGYLLSVGTSTLVGTLPRGLQAQWVGVAAHLSAAFCLRQNMANGLALDEGVLSPDGKLLHAEGVAKIPSAREALRHAVRGIDAARSRHRKQPTESLDAWQAIVSGRWTLVEAHEQDGRRFLLARVNDLAAPANKALSKRERQVAGLVAQGASNKEIAYRPETIACHASSDSLGCLRRRPLAASMPRTACLSASRALGVLAIPSACKSFPSGESTPSSGARPRDMFSRRQKAAERCAAMRVHCCCKESGNVSTRTRVATLSR